MTTTVSIQALCSTDKEVLVTIDDGNTGETFCLQGGETTERYAYGDRQIIVREVLKVEAGRPTGIQVAVALDSALAFATGDQAIEQEIQAKGLTAPRITSADIEANIAGEYYFTADAAVSGVTSGMVDRFLCWKLPEDFGPDCGISFAPFHPSGTTRFEPVGTNLLTADQARAMLTNVVGEGAPVMPALSLLTFCVLVLKNGFTVTGESACASPENFDAEIGRKVARQNAVDKCWSIMGYALKERLSKGGAA